MKETDYDTFCRFIERKIEQFNEPLPPDFYLSIAAEMYESLLSLEGKLFLIKQPHFIPGLMQQLKDYSAQPTAAYHRPFQTYAQEILVVVRNLYPNAMNYL
jgi:hypothetical protein